MLKLLYLPILLLLATNVQAQNEDPTCPNPDDCILFVDTDWVNMNNPTKPDPTRDLRRLTVGPLLELDSIFIKIGTERDKGEVLNMSGKLNIPGRYVDFGKSGIKYMNQENSYNVEIDFDLMQRTDKDKFIFLTIRAVNNTGTMRDMRVRQIGQSLATNSSIKTLLQYTAKLDPKTKLLNLQYFLSSPSIANIALYSTNGNEVKKLEINTQQAGHNLKVYDLNGLGAGIYFLQLQLGQTSITEKIIIQ